MLIREALRAQAPSLALQRAAADEIARLDAEVLRLQREVDAARDAHRDTIALQVQPMREALQATVDAMLPPGTATPERMATFGAPWPQVAAALWRRA